ncbi:MAG TPA: hypothetical protein VHC70_06630, partial [Phycisphaerales bacterium]|nr:hypothetical protein [Phycisphaerales bacterium]
MLPPASESPEELLAASERARRQKLWMLAGILLGIPATIGAAWLLGNFPAASIAALICGIGTMVAFGIAARRSMLRRDALRTRYFNALGNAEIQVGERFSSGRVSVWDGETLFLITDISPRRMGLFRLGGAIACAALGIWLLNTTLNGGQSIKQIAAGWAGAVLWPLLMAMPFTTSWGASRSAADGQPGLIFQRFWLFFIPRIEVLPSTDVASLAIEIRKEHGQPIAELWVRRHKGRARALASSRAGTIDEKRLFALLNALKLAMDRV